MTPQETLHSIGERFNELRKQSMGAAYRYLQEALMTNVDVLVPTVIPLKDFLAAVTELEDFLKGSVSQAGQSPIEYLQRWLNAPADEPPPGKVM